MEKCQLALILNNKAGIRARTGILKMFCKWTLCASLSLLLSSFLLSVLFFFTSFEAASVNKEHNGSIIDSSKIWHLAEWEREQPRCLFLFTTLSSLIKYRSNPALPITVATTVVDYYHRINPGSFGIFGCQLFNTFASGTCSYVFNPLRRIGGYARSTETDESNDANMISVCEIYLAILCAMLFLLNFFVETSELRKRQWTVGLEMESRT